MSNCSGFFGSRNGGSNRFYTPPVYNERLQVQKPEPFEPDVETGSNEPALPTPVNLSNLESLLSSMTPVVAVRFPSEPLTKGGRTFKSVTSPYFTLDDLWESFREWSAYGVEVPLILNGDEPIKQYYVPFLSAIQLYAEPKGLSSADQSSKETIKVGGTGSEADKQVSGGNMMSINSQRFSRLTLREGTAVREEAEVYNSRGQLVYEFFERTPPHFRPPLHDKVSTLASAFPNLKNYKSCDISTSSWFSVAWYPIYQIPVGSTLKSLDASFLTFHSLSTNSMSKNQTEKVDGPLMISLPVFGLATYKLRGSILAPTEASELRKMDSLFKTATNWLQNLKAKHPDYDYFASRSHKWIGWEM